MRAPGTVTGDLTKDEKVFVSLTIPQVTAGWDSPHIEREHISQCRIKVMLDTSQHLLHKPLSSYQNDL